MEIRVQRSVSVQPKFTREFARAALETEAHASRVMGVESDLFYHPRDNGGTAQFRIFTDFQSMAQYEEVFLGKLLHDATYLEMSARAVEMITDEPLDEMFVRLRTDDFFMNLGAKDRPKFSFEAARSRKKARYRREREYCASKGKLRDVMRMNFDFIESMFRATGNPADYFCTRFSVERIGCSKAYWDLDDCPVCDPAFLEQDAVIQPGMLLSMPLDRIYVRLTPEVANFNLAANAKR